MNKCYKIKEKIKNRAKEFPSKVTFLVGSRVNFDYYTMTYFLFIFRLKKQTKKC